MAEPVIISRMLRRTTGTVKEILHNGGAPDPLRQHGRSKTDDMRAVRRCAVIHELMIIIHIKLTIRLIGNIETGITRRAERFPNRLLTCFYYENISRLKNGAKSSPL